MDSSNARDGATSLISAFCVGPKSPSPVNCNDRFTN